MVRRRVTHRLTRLQTMSTFLNIAKHSEITTQFQFTGTATKPHPNRKFRQFNNDQYLKRYASDACLGASNVFRLYFVSRFQHELYRDQEAPITLRQ